MSRYHQFCGVARGLDVVGDRWALLVVRDLMHGPRRFSELRSGLPGIASNLLVRRLDELQAAGVVERRLADRGHAYALTDHGLALRPVLHALVRWSAPGMAAGPRPDEHVDAAWLALAAEALLDERRTATPRTVRLDVVEPGSAPGGSVTVVVDADGARAHRDAPPGEPTARLAGPPAALLGVVAGALDREGAAARGVTVDDPQGWLLPDAGGR